MTSDRGALSGTPTICWRSIPLEAALVGNTPVVEEFSNLELEAGLLETSLAELANAALERGDFQRGRKVFYQSAAACFACHDPPKGTARLGPDLTSLKTTLSPEQLVNALLPAVGADRQGLRPGERVGS